MAVSDLTEIIKNINYSDKSEIKKSKINNISLGLYAMIFINPIEISIIDKNKQKNSPVLGKTVVPPRSVVLKAGKFQGGLISRMQSYEKHMHHEGVPDKSIFKSCLTRAIIFPMDDFKRQMEKSLIPSSIYEGYWNQSIFQHLKNNDILTEIQNYRTEYRTLKSSEYCLGNHFFSFMEKIASNIKISENILS